MCSPPGVLILWSRLVAGRLRARAGGSSRLCVAVIASNSLLGSSRDGAHRGVTWQRPPSWFWELASHALPEVPGSLVVSDGWLRPSWQTWVLAPCHPPEVSDLSYGWAAHRLSAAVLAGLTGLGIRRGSLLWTWALSPHPALGSSDLSS